MFGEKNAEEAKKGAEEQELSSQKAWFTPADRKTWALAIPNIISNISTPLLGLVDTAIIGHLPDGGDYLAAMAIGTAIFNLAYNVFVFLRMGTTGLVAQAKGAGDAMEIAATAIRALLMGVLCGLLVLVSRSGIERMAFSVMEGTPEVFYHAK
jgi:MATE family multidrug resistance protein